MRVGLLGEKLSHSFSPIIHNLIYEKLGITLNYELFEVKQDDIHNFKDYMLKNNISAVNITIPYKKTFLENIDFISESARKIGSINLLYIKNNKFYGENTDYNGFKYTLIENKIDVKNKRVFIIGKGGAALTVRKVLEDMEAGHIENIFRKDKKSSIFFDTNLKGDILINTTPVGMYPNVNENIAPDNFISNFQIAIDLIYNPVETEFLKSAKKFGLKTVNGMSMLIEQAIDSDEIIFSRTFTKEERVELRKDIQNKLIKHF